MLDVLNWAKQHAGGNGNRPAVLSRFGLSERAYLLATVHRSENTNDVAQLSRIFEALDSLEEPIVFPVHPRTRKMLDQMQVGSRAEAHFADHFPGSRMNRTVHTSLEGGPRREDARELGNIGGLRRSVSRC